MAEKFTFKQFKEQYPNDEACLHSILMRKYGKDDLPPKGIPALS